MLKKIFIFLASILLMSGCTVKYNLDTLTLDEGVNLAIKQNMNLYNVNNIGYRYYLPRGYKLYEDRENIQTITNNNTKLYLNVDLISYYNKTEITRGNAEAVYQFISFENGDKKGFLEINQNNDYFLVKMVYNYAIIEASVEERDLKKVAMNMAYILSSIKYNDTVINNKFGEDVLEFDETVYKIFGPVKEADTKNYAYYLEQYDAYTGEIEQIKDPDKIEN